MTSALMTPDQLRDFCLAFPSSTAEYPFRDSTVCTFKVAGKVFALSTLTSDPLTVSLKCEPEVALVLRAAHPAIIPGYHLNKRHWNTVTVDDSLPAGLIEEMIEDSFDLVVDTLPRYRRLNLR